MKPYSVKIAKGEPVNLDDTINPIIEELIERVTSHIKDETDDCFEIGGIAKQNIEIIIKGYR